MRMKINQKFPVGASVTGSISRRSFLAAGAVAALPAVAVAEVAAKTDRLPQSLESQMDDCVAQLQSILMQMHPETTGCNHRLESRGDGTFWMSVQGYRKFAEYDGPGLYQVSGRLNDIVECWLERFNHVNVRTGEPIAGCFYFSSIFCVDGTAAEETWNYSPKIIRKIKDGYAPTFDEGRL
ncbi:hypothetical protein [Agrobacterium tumefaciens]|uniref:hypothetical protein n=2 Tax=Agrobacterium tumefaciens TaxID=358 RepID=UPI0015739D8F|nr:hypothetical protein [Agrobacterium tumefaciens]NSZ40649.1 hypothetical protein [Agrobacterium tumefaciens]NTB42064.1 hypothetical protein [Agrobacterium tumefaciens]NTB51262.1 hypothetical protein [Agrobacterium tumefaciens]NTB73680.1 hypothetical protein [Agrobacterium tumefaciens]NTB94352.1 hypothetical protein [Agrobacterium tumefaciens]